MLAKITHFVGSLQLLGILTYNTLESLGQLHLAAVSALPTIVVAIHRQSQVGMIVLLAKKLILGSVLSIET